MVERASFMTDYRVDPKRNQFQWLWKKRKEKNIFVKPLLKGRNGFLFFFILNLIYITTGDHSPKKKNISRRQVEMFLLTGNDRRIRID